MRLERADWKSGTVTLTITTPEDLWVLTQIVEPTDTVKSRTLRKIKIGGEDERTTSIIKKPVTLTISVEKISLALERDSLRIGGVVSQGPEDVPLGSHHTINVEINTKLTIVKRNWLSFQKERLIESTKASANTILIVVHDREEAIIAISGPDSYKILTTLKGQVQKKYAEQQSTDFYKEVSSMIDGYIEKRKPSHVIVASPAFWKEELFKRMSDDAKKVAIQATCSSVSENAIREVLARPETRTALQSDRIAKESNAVEELLESISKDAPNAYGLDHVKNAAMVGAVEMLLVTDTLLFRKKEDGDFDAIESIMKAVESAKGTITLVSGAHEAGQKLDGLGGIGAILRYQLN